MRSAPFCLALTFAACGSRSDPDRPPLDGAVCAASAGGFSTTLDNPFFPLPTGGAAWVLEGGGERVEIRALDATEVVAGVTTRVVEERETEDGELTEISRNFMVQAADGTVCYYGEDVDLYEGGVVVGHGGAWRAGVNGAEPGILMPGAPAVGQWYRQETAIGVAEDRAEHVAMGQRVTVTAGTFSDTLRVEEWSPLDSGTSLKVYVRGVGLIIDQPVERIP